MWIKTNAILSLKSNRVPVWGGGLRASKYLDNWDSISSSLFPQSKEEFSNSLQNTWFNSNSWQANPSKSKGEILVPVESGWKLSFPFLPFFIFFFFNWPVSRRQPFKKNQLKAEKTGTVSEKQHLPTGMCWRLASFGISSSCSEGNGMKVSQLQWNSLVSNQTKVPNEYSHGEQGFNQKEETFK